MGMEAEIVEPTAPVVCVSAGGQFTMVLCREERTDALVVFGDDSDFQFGRGIRTRGSCTPTLMPPVTPSGSRLTTLDTGM